MATFKPASELPRDWAGGEEPANVEPAPKDKYWRTLRASGLVATQADLDDVCTMEEKGTMAQYQRVMKAVLVAKHDPTTHAVQQAIHHIKAPQRKLSAGEHFWVDFAIAVFIGASGVDARGQQSTGEDGPDPCLYDPHLCTAAQHLAKFYDAAVWALPERPHTGYLDEDFATVGRSLYLVWVTGGLQPGLWRFTEWWGEKEYLHVDCAFGLIAAARHETFNKKAAGEALPGMKVHIEVRWGKLTGAALYTALRDYYASA